MEQAVALVESPAQLLNVIEWAHVSPEPVPVSIMVLPPAQPAARAQLHRMTGLALDAGCTVSWHEVRGSRGTRLRALRSIAARLSGVSTLIIGDPFSGFLQLVIDLIRPGHLVVVDDGSATMRFAEIMDTGGDLVRWHRADRGSVISRGVAARAKHRLQRAEVELFTAMPVRPRGMTVRRNDLGWTRRRFPTPDPLPGADLVGSSLVESGVVGEHHYLGAVGALATAHRATRYLAHRKESAEKLARIEDLGLQVICPDLPLEVFARTGPAAERLISFPSTVVHTLPLALADTGVEVLVCDIDRQWFRSGLSPAESAGFLDTVTSTARSTYGLSSVAAA